MGHEGPHFYKWLGTGGTVNKRTANKKLTKLYWLSRKRLPKQLIVLLKAKSRGPRPKKNFPAQRIGASHFRPRPVPHFQIRSGATAQNIIHFVSKKPFYILNNSEKNGLILIIFTIQKSEEI